MLIEKPNIYDNKLKRRELIKYCEKLEYRLEQEKEKDRFRFWLHYLTFIFSFFLGAAVVRVGTEMLNSKGFEWFILAVIIIVLSPIVYLFIKEIIKK